jgi:hypothetical protein
VTRFDVAEPLDHDSDVERHHERDERLEWHLDPELTMWLFESLCEHGAPLGIHDCEPPAELGVVPRERLQLEPDLFVRGVLAQQVADRCPPLVDERGFGRVELPLTRDEPLGEALERPEQQVLVRAEVVVDEAVIDPGLLGEAPRRDAGVADLDKQPLGSVEQRVLCGRAGGAPSRGLDNSTS